VFGNSIKKMPFQETIANFFKGHDRTVKAKKNILASFAIRGASILINLLLVPMTINYVNPTKYGIWLTLSSIIAWFSFFDIGFGNGLRNKLTEARSRGENELAQSYVSTTYALFISVFAAIWVLFIFINKHLDWARILNAPVEMRNELSILALIVLSYFCLQFIFKTINIVLTADQKPAKAAFLDMLGQAIALAIIFILTKTTQGSLVILGLALGLAPVLILIISSVWFYRGEYKNIRPILERINFKYAKDIMGLGLKFFIVQIAALVIFQTNNIIIAQTCGPEIVTVYNIAYKYFGIVSMLFMIILMPFWSAFTDAYVQNDTKWMKTTLNKLELVWIVIAFGGILLLLFSKFFYHFWIGDKVLIPYSVSLLMLLYFLVFTRFSLYIHLLNGIGKIKLQLIFNVILALLNIPFLLFLGSKYGLTGILIGNVIISLPHTMYSPIQLKKIIENKAMGIWNK
jgi:O-antigen/teichoic acid export membrane protein